jgi:hypothetical protein
MLKVAIFGYKDKNDLGDFLKEIKTDLKENDLIKWCEKTFKGYAFFSFSWDNGLKPDFIGALK